ncbi:MAG: hypothetical protein HQ559_11240 [Lentisphaerae bacterium]|nr:hypothetical protein [Lentisphaerota bacterium]
MSAETPAKVVPHLVDWLIRYPENCTPVLLLSELNELAAGWPGWEKYPWRITHNIQRFVNTPPSRQRPSRRVS